MNKEWIDLLDKAKKHLGDEIVNEIITTVEDVANEQSSKIKEQAERVTDYFVQLTKGEITKEEFKMYLLDIKDLLEMEALQLSVETKMRVLKFVELVRSVLLSNLDNILTLFK